MRTADTNFTLLAFRTCILFIFCYFYFLFYIYFLFFFLSFLFLFFPFRVCLFVCLFFLSLTQLFNWFSLFSLSYCILIFHLSLHLYSNNTLLLVFYFLFFFIQVIHSLSYYCYSKSHTAPFPSLTPFCHLSALYYCGG